MSNEFELEELIETLRNAKGIIIEDDIKNNVYPITQISRISDDTKEEIQLQIVEELCAIFAH